MVFTNITPFPFQMGALTNVAPLTHRDATTFSDKLETLAYWFNTVLVPDSNAMIANAIEEFQTGIANAEAHIDLTKAEHVALVGTALENVTLALTAAIAESTEIAEEAKAETIAEVNEAKDAAIAASLLVGSPAGAAVDAAIQTGGAARATLDSAIEEIAASPDGESAYNFFDIRKLFAGVAAWCYGNSWLNSPNYGATQYALQLPGKVGLASMTELASSGFRMQDTAVHILGTDATYNWPAGRKGFVLIGDLLNNLIEDDTTANRDTALESMRASVALLNAATRTEASDASFTYSGAWSTLTASSLSNGSARYMTHTVSNVQESASYIDIAIPAGQNYLCFTGTMFGSASQGGVAIIKEGATELGRIATDDKSVATPYGMALGVRAPVVFKIPGTTARTVRVTFTGRTATSEAHILVVDCLITQSTTPPLVVLVKPVEVLNATHDKPALLTYLRTIPDLVAAEFSNVVVVDPATGWDPETMLGADDLHPNILGQNHIANVTAETLKTEFLKRALQNSFGILT